MTPGGSSTGEEVPLLRMVDISKAYPGVQALDGICLELRAGEVLAVLGENGAGKSTLMKVLSGAVRADSGTIQLGGVPVLFEHPAAARAAGVAVIYQEFNLVPSLTVSENLFLGRDITRHGFLQPRAEQAGARAIFERMGVRMDLETRCQDLTTAQQQLVEIARALAAEARILVMDEPSAALTSHEVEMLFSIVRELRRSGLGIIYISHRLEEIFAIADRVQYLRDGKPAGGALVRGLTRSAMIAGMVGRDLHQEVPPRPGKPGGELVLEARDLCRGRAVRSVSFGLRRGEILALTGLVGSGRTETARLLFGADIPDSGSILRNGRPVRINSPLEAIEHGIALLPEDRKLQGLVLAHSLEDNFALPSLHLFESLGFLNRSRTRSAFDVIAQKLRLKAPGWDCAARTLSGGNQQKIVLAKWLARSCEVLIFDEPTRGVDVGAKFEIYCLMRELVAEGRSIFMISSDMPEVLGIADRILVMHDGRITGEVADASTATQEMLMQLAIA